jgi:hypothetical protein
VVAIARSSQRHGCHYPHNPTQGEAMMELIDALAILATQRGSSYEQRTSIIISAAYDVVSAHAKNIKANYKLNEAEEKQLAMLRGATDD